MKDKNLIIVRHAHRDTSEGRERDNSLSERGKDQAKAVARYFKERYGKEEALLLASPKVRCIETLLPLADRLGTEVKVVDLLDEKHEPQPDFERRVEKFFRWWKQRGPSLVVACSHGDWIPTFSQQVLGISLDLRKGAWLEMGGHGRHTDLLWLLQKL